MYRQIIETIAKNKLNLCYLQHSCSNLHNSNHVSSIIGSVPIMYYSFKVYYLLAHLKQFNRYTDKIITDLIKL
jgi:hypothetical protein